MHFGFRPFFNEVSPGLGAGGGGVLPGQPQEATPPAAEPEPQQPQVEYAQIPADEYQAMQEQIERLTGYVQSLPIQPVPQPGQEPQAPQTPNFDPWSDNPGQQIAEIVGGVLDQRLGTYEDRFREQELAELRGDASAQLHDIALREGEFLVPSREDGAGMEELALGRALELYPDYASRYGDGPRAEEAAFAQAYQEAKQLEEAIIAAHETRQQNQAATLHGAPREPGPSGGAVSAPQVGTTPGGIADVLNKHFPGARLAG